MQVLREADILWRLDGAEQPVLTGILASTEFLTVGRVDLRPGQRTEVQSHAGEEGLYLLEGGLNVRTFGEEGARWFELKPGDGFYLPEGVPHQYYNITEKPVKFLFGVAPDMCPPAR
jgi:quercetin dioxygenase-like cupin family protein